MRRLLKQGFVWQFAGGFALGTAALFALHPSEVRQQVAIHVAHRHGAERG